MSPSTCAAPPTISSRFIGPPRTLNTIDRLSGDQNGRLASSVPAEGLAVVESSDCSHKEVTVGPAAEKTT